MIPFPENKVAVTQIPVEGNVQLFLKREDIIHPEISGNKYWKLFYNINSYLDSKPEKPLLITFGGAYSNHISAVAACGNLLKIETLGMIRGEELAHKWRENPTLKRAHENGMTYKFVTRSQYRNKEMLAEMMKKTFPDALIIPEGGTSDEAVCGIQHMLNSSTESFDYLCSAVGTGGTAAGLSRFAGKNQKVLGFAAVRDESLEEKIFHLSGRQNFELIESSFGGYGKISEDIIRFINEFRSNYGILLEPLYTGKMMKKLIEMIEADFFPSGAKILAFHTGGLQAIEGVNEFQRRKNGLLINTSN